MWRELMEKLDKEKDPKKYWKDIGRTLGRKKKPQVENIKNENEIELKTKEEIVNAFKNRLERTFKIGEEENQEFCEETEREVEEWILGSREKLQVRERVEYIDTPEIKPELILDILKDFKNKTPGHRELPETF